MLEKEEGYDEFLAEKIRLGQADIAAGRFVTKEQANARMEKLFARLAAEQRLRDSEIYPQ